MIIYRKIMYIFIIQILSAKYNRARESIFAGGGRGRMGKKKDGGRKAGGADGGWLRRAGSGK